MRKFIRFLAGLILIVSILSCRSLALLSPTSMPLPNPTAPEAPTPTVVKLPQLTGNWHISLNQSGGIMGMSRALEISSSGEMTLTDLRTNNSNQMRLPADKQATLTELVTATTYKPVSTPSGCADCFIFDLKIIGAGEDFHASMNQIDLADSGLQPLIDFLAEYMRGTVK